MKVIEISITLSKSVDYIDGLVSESGKEKIKQNLLIHNIEEPNLSVLLFKIQYYFIHIQVYTDLNSVSRSEMGSGDVEIILYSKLTE